LTGQSSQARQQQGQHAPARQRDDRADDEPGRIQVIRGDVGLHRAAALRPGVKHRHREEDRNDEDEEPRNGGRRRRERRAQTLSPAPAGEGVDQQQHEAADRQLAPEQETDEPAGRRGFRLHDGERDEPGCGRRRGDEQSGQAEGRAVAHRSTSLASGAWATVARRDSCNARI
jgi:hypothetical protein